MEPSLDELTLLTRQVILSLLGMDTERLDGAPVPAHTDLVACVQITGAWQGTVVLACARAVAEAITAAMFGDPQATATDELHDAMGEMANMIAGNVKRLLPGPSKLSLPTVADATDLPPTFSGVDVTSQALFAVDFGTLGVQVLHADGWHRRRPRSFGGRTAVAT